MPKNREQIKHEGQHSAPWISPNFGDGGWHTQIGALQFDPRDIEPLGDHILVELDSESMRVNYVTRVILPPDICTNKERITRVGTVLKVGPGRRKYKDSNRDFDFGVRLPMTLKPGDRVIVGQYSDWESWDYDYEGRGANIGVFQEADVRLIVNDSLGSQEEAPAAVSR